MTQFTYRITDARGTRTVQMSANHAEFYRSRGDDVLLASQEQAAAELVARIAANSLEWERNTTDYIPLGSA